MGFVEKETYSRNPVKFSYGAGNQMIKKQTLAIMTTLCLIASALLCTFNSANASGFYVSPRLGGVVSLERADADASFGVALGYRWFKLVSVELGYTRVTSSIDTNFLDANLVVTGYTPILSPYAIVGAGAMISNDVEEAALFRIGGGIIFNIIPLVKPFVQLSYLNTDGDNHFIEPIVGASLGF